MKLTLEQVTEMNQVQLDIFKAFTDVCSQLGLKYYMVHGSLLGTIKYQGFFPFDDDIDVAMPRKDYDRLLLEGQKYMPENMFVQSIKSEKGYPLIFSKIRNSETAFIQPRLKQFSINQGMFIDVFPIDNWPDNYILRKWLNMKELFYKIRISAEIQKNESVSVFKKMAFFISRLLLPSWEKAIRMKEKLYSNVSDSGRVIVVGGKDAERGIPAIWFNNGQEQRFENMEITTPADVNNYLTCIYGDYKNYNPVGKYMNEDNTLTVSAEMISTSTSYKAVIR